jgi:hypothetical protein
MKASLFPWSKDIRQFRLRKAEKRMICLFIAAKRAIGRAGAVEAIPGLPASPVSELNESEEFGLSNEPSTSN